MNTNQEKIQKLKKKNLESDPHYTYKKSGGSNESGGNLGPYAENSPEQTEK